MRRATVSTMLALAAVVSGCGTTTEPVAAPITTTSGTDTSSTDTSSADTSSADTTTTVTRPEWSGPSTLIAKHLDDLVAVDVSDGSRTKLADRGDLAAAHGVIEAYIDAVELSPDGRTVLFGFWGHLDDDYLYALYEVPADGSTEPKLREIPGVPGGVSHLEYSPDGRFLLAVVGRLMVVVPAEGGGPVSPGIDMPYPPRYVIWSPGGDQLLWLPHTERRPCCWQASVRVDPATGQYASEIEGGEVQGPPFFDAAGSLRTYPYLSHRALDLDATRRYAVAVDGEDPDRPVVWWDTTDPDAEPQPLGVELTHSDEGGVALSW